jgi:hypothetical protein
MAKFREDQLKLYAELNEPVSHDHVLTKVYCVIRALLPDSDWFSVLYGQYVQYRNARVTALDLLIHTSYEFAVHICELK